MFAETPFFVIHEDVLEENVGKFKEAMATCWPHSILAYSVKTNSLPWVLRKMKELGLAAEVVSDEEYELALLSGFCDSEIVFNGPIKSEKYIKRALENGAVVNLDAEREVDWCLRYACEKSIIGVRANVPIENFPPDDVGSFEGGFRFGFAEVPGGLFSILAKLSLLPNQAKVGIHLHCNSVTRSLDVYREIAKYASNIVSRSPVKISFIDFGGGFFGGVEGKPTPHEYLAAINEKIEDVVDFDDTTLLIEPGSALVGSTADLVTTVLDTKSVKNARIVTTDGSRLHIDPLWKKERYLYSIESSASVCTDSQVICGYTCMDHDRIMTIRDCPQLFSGDRIVYHRVGAYSMTLGGMFIRYLPDVYVERNGALRKVRSRITTQQYLEINSV